MTPITALRAAIVDAQNDFQEEIVHQTIQLAETISKPTFEAATLPSLLKNMEQRRDRAQHRLVGLRQELKKFETKSGSEKKESFLDFLRSENLQKNLKLGVYAFLPAVIPLEIAGKSLANHLGLPGYFENLGNSLTQTFKESQEARQRFFEKYETATQNPDSLEDFQKNNLFVLDESGFNKLVTQMLEQSGNKKVRNLKFSFEGDYLQIKGEYETKVCWVDFKARLKFEVKDGEVSGKLYKVQAAGFDLSSLLETDILGAFRKFGIGVPGNASLKDLSWIQIPGMKGIELAYNRLVFERQPAPVGPS